MHMLLKSRCLLESNIWKVHTRPHDSKNDKLANTLSYDKTHLAPKILVNRSNQVAYIVDSLPTRGHEWSLKLRKTSSMPSRSIRSAYELRSIHYKHFKIPIWYKNKHQQQSTTQK